MAKLDKKDIEGLSKADKKKRLRLWEKECPIIEVGDSKYEVEPQPARAVLQFQDLIQLYVDYAKQYALFTEETEDAEKAEAEDKDAEKAEPRDWIKELRGLVETVVKSPYHLLKPLIPDLEQEDAEAAPWGQVWHNLSVLAEINGLGWGEKLLKEYIVPFVPELLRSVLTLGTGAAKTAISLGESGSPNSTSSSTSSPESPTDSTSEEP